MLQKTRAVVFRHVKYSETSIIVTLFTEQFGLQSYIINGIRGNSKTNKIALFQPLTLLDLVVYHKENASIMRIKEAKCFYLYGTLSYEIKKSSIALFVCEILNKAVKEQSHAQEIFQFIVDSLIHLDTHNTIENFHLQFLLGLSSHLGIGTNQVNELLGSRIADDEEELILKQLIQSNYTTPIAINYGQRQRILMILLRFYANHIDNFGEVKSVAVLKDVLS